MNDERICESGCMCEREKVCLCLLNHQRLFFFSTSLKLTSLNIQNVTSLLSANKQLSLSEHFIKDFKVYLFLRKPIVYVAFSIFCLPTVIIDDIQASKTG